MSLILKNINKKLLTNRLIGQNAIQCIQRAALCDQKDSKIETDENAKRGGFAQAFERHTTPQEPAVVNQSIAFLLKNSKFIDMGDPEGKIVTGKIFHIVEDDLYIDFGWKFHCVCTRPTRNGSDYVRGAKVRLRIRDLELSTKFLGSNKDLTILESDCQLLGIISSPARGQLLT